MFIANDVLAVTPRKIPRGRDSRPLEFSPFPLPLDCNQSYTYHVFVMKFGHRILAFVTTFAVVLNTVNCACAGGMMPANRPHARSMPCCTHHHGAMRHCSHGNEHSDKNQPGPCDGACSHCAQTVINDTLTPPSHDLSVVPHAFAPLLSVDLTVARCDRSRDSLVAASADLPPPAPRTTLFGLKCALNT